MTLLPWVILVLVAVFAVPRLVPYIQGYFAFYPTRRVQTTPADYGVTYRDLEIPVEPSVSLHAWLLPGPGPAVLFAHGNAGNLGDRAGWLARLNMVGFSVLGFDYRGYGWSSGRPSEEGLYRDAQAAYQALREALPDRKVILWGRSLGGAVVIDLANRVEADAVVVESTFGSVEDFFPRNPVYRVLGPFSTLSFGSIEKVRHLKVPILVIHGTEDQVVPVELGRRLYQAAPLPKAWLEVPGAGHGDTDLVGAREYYERIIEFLAEQGIDELRLLTRGRSQGAEGSGRGTRLK